MRQEQTFFSRCFKGLCLITALVLLSACAPHRDSLYSWNGYEATLYQYYQKDQKSLEEQIATMNESLEKSRAENKSVPPGFHAHLGLLYANTGHANESRREFETEKALFPESTAFMNYLLDRQKGKAQ